MSLTRSIGAVQNLETPPATAPEMSRLVLESAGGSSEGLPDRRCRSVGLAVGVLRSRLPSPLMRPNRPLLSPRFSGWCGHRAYRSCSLTFWLKVNLRDIFSFDLHPAAGFSFLGFRTPTTFSEMPTTFFEILRALFFICGAADEGLMKASCFVAFLVPADCSFQPKISTWGSGKLCAQIRSVAISALSFRMSPYS